jgi:hypothetical protein
VAKPSAWPEGTAVYPGIFAAALFALLQGITILNRRHHFRGFVYQYDRFAFDHKASKSPCGRAKARWRFVPAAISRRPAVLVEEVPWGNGKHQLTNVYILFLARWAWFTRSIAASFVYSTVS